MIKIATCGTWVTVCLNAPNVTLHRYRSRGGLHKHKTKFHLRCLPSSVTSSQVPVNSPQEVNKISAGLLDAGILVSASSKEVFNSGAQGLFSNSDGLSDDFYAGNPGTSNASQFPHLYECGYRFHDRDSLRRHHKICPVWTSSSCRFCEPSFDNFKSRKAHEQKSHKAQWNEAMEDRLLAYQDRKGSRTLPLIKQVTTSARSVPRRIAAIAAWRR